MVLEGVVNRKLEITLLSMFGLAFLLAFPIDFPLQHTHEGPVYHEDDHDVCRAAGWIFGLLLFFYVHLTISLFWNRHALEQTWAQRLLVWPNLFMGVIGFTACMVLLASYSTHDDHAFTRTLGILNGLVLGLNTFYCMTIIQNPLAEGFKYGWTFFVFPTSVFLILLFFGSIWEKQYYLTVIAGLIFVPFMLGSMDAKKQAKNEPYKF
eukprot:TRINITY_DN580_c0_g1_i1.p1 TRINITY_DN580_c0_g1~~TRINITY_DN580_c0_g1_i1.p1  ORF type:complete len:208 (-),score=20.98 TRINITY_DN580_c0_g1_i1:109-732(-)